MSSRPRALQAADFRRVLATRPCSRTAHFALYHVDTQPKHEGGDLSTPMTSLHRGAVDDAVRLGLVVPKRLAKRAATRNLVKRQARALFDVRPGVVGVWAPGDWVIRQSRTFEVKQFSSAASEALRLAVHGELQQLLATASAKSTSQVRAATRP